MFRALGILIATVTLGATLASATYMSYAGWGVVNVGPASARQGSIFGPGVLGGGPGSGK